MSNKKVLDPKVYTPLKEGESYSPYIAAEENIAEFTFKAVGLGILFGIISGAANAYLGLRAGLTISTSIPVAVKILMKKILMTVTIWTISHKPSGFIDVLKKGSSEIQNLNEWSFGIR